MPWEWNNVTNVDKRSYTCGFCGNKVGPDSGYVGIDSSHARQKAYIMVCPCCSKPTFMDDEGQQTPNIRMGNEVEGIDDEGVKSLVSFRQG